MKMPFLGWETKAQNAERPTQIQLILVLPGCKGLGSPQGGKAGMREGSWEGSLLRWGHWGEDRQPQLAHHMPGSAPLRARALQDSTSVLGAKTIPPRPRQAGQGASQA